MQMQANGILITKIGIYFGETKHGMTDTSRVPSVIWSVADAAEKFYTDDTIVAYMVVLSSNTHLKYNTKILYSPLPRSTIVLREPGKTCVRMQYWQYRVDMRSPYNSS